MIRFLKMDKTAERRSCCLFTHVIASSERPRNDVESTLFSKS